MMVAFRTLFLYTGVKIRGVERGRNTSFYNGK